jgi:hypothetical protein
MQEVVQIQVLTATRETQGRRDDDFCWTVEGELVLFTPMEYGHGDVNDRCGCLRSMAGVVSYCATTTVKVVERNDLDLHTYRGLIGDALADMGYVPESVQEEPEVRSGCATSCTSSSFWRMAARRARSSSGGAST